MSYPGQRMYDPKTRRYIGRFVRPVGSAFVTVRKEGEPEKKIRREKAQ